MPMTSESRTEPPEVAGELATLTGFLQFHRDTLVWKCEGLTDEQLRSRAVPPSNLSLLGLVRHLAEVERGWFRTLMNGESDLAELYCTPENRDGDFDDVADADVAEAWRNWHAEVAKAQEIAAAVPSLDTVYVRQRPGRPEVSFSARWVITHMIEEYSRHNGHADLLRELIDGETGE